MSVDFNNLLVALVFLLPGFLTSRLIAARTPAMGKEASVFQETFESLLRSVYIHLVILPLIYLVEVYAIRGGNSNVFYSILRDMLKGDYYTQASLVITLFFSWLVGAFSLATIFGYFWDPLEVLFSKLVKKTGTKSEDIFYQLREHVVNKRDAGEKNYQFWIQTRLKNGCKYQGEFYFVGYRHDGMSREIVLANVTFFPAQVDGQPQGVSQKYNFVMLDLANCESLEVLFSNSSP